MGHGPIHIRQADDSTSPWHVMIVGGTCVPSSRGCGGKTPTTGFPKVSYTFGRVGQGREAGLFGVDQGREAGLLTLVLSKRAAPG